MIMLKHLAAGLIGTALLAGPVLAETTPAPNNAQFITQEKAGQWRASKLKGLNVYNNNNDKIGDINELLVDSSGKVEAVVVGVGGFLGVGEHDVAVPFNQIKFTAEKAGKKTDTSSDKTKTTPETTGSTGTDAAMSAPDHAILNMTKDQLKAAPQFKYAR